MTKRKLKRTPKLKELVGSTVDGIELEKDGLKADDRVVAVLRLESGRVWRATRTILDKLRWQACGEQFTEVHKLLLEHCRATDEVVAVEESQDELQEIVQGLKDYFRFYDGLPFEEVLAVLDVQRLRDEVHAKLEAEEEHKKSEAEANDAEEARQTTVLRVSDLEVDL